jgi:signal transduction histidine kinase
VLVVEDVRRLAEDIGEGLRDQGMAVDVAYDGLEAAAKIELHGYDVIVLDRDLPGMHGDVVCRMVTASGNPAMILMLARMVDNLIDNAIRHNDPGGWLNVHGHAEQRAATLVIENGGPRLQADDVRRVAQPFARLGPDRVASENGVGLGLSIVAAIATAHAGRLDLEARPDGGLRAQVTLPAPAA